MERQVYKIDAKDKVLGRLATDIATHLIGKHRADYQPHIDNGDVVEVSNMKEIAVTGRKMEQKKYFRHSGFPGGIKTRVMGKMFAEDPKEILRMAVSRMLPKNKHREARLKRLKIS